ncbi:hypothetical protein BV25DRAFT_74418 [Artomyces pyxidatus]|uniref:Uncharacterized protein n=1 Tax=Artomyces pyxidatus TaxID=48021 RepID=A0ACB8TKN9_9AGAM|nr:hypothetical protein BV25DRAFT_74418 [Artomyces pyxidatus]
MTFQSTTFACSFMSRHGHALRLVARRAHPRMAHRSPRPRHLSSAPPSPKPSSPHAQFYTDLLPAMVPIALLGSAVFLGLQLLQSRLSLEKYLDEARAQVDALEAEVDALAARTGARRPEGVVSAEAKPRGWGLGAWFK